jgi:hypothetical protein
LLGNPIAQIKNSHESFSRGYFNLKSKELDRVNICSHGKTIAWREIDSNQKIDRGLFGTSIAQNLHILVQYNIQPPRLQ